MLKNLFYLFLYYLGFCTHCNTLHASGNKYVDVTDLKKKLSSPEREIYKSAFLTLTVRLEQSSSHVIPYYGSLCPALESLYFKIFEKNKNLKNDTLSLDMLEILEFIYSFRISQKCISDDFFKKLVSVDHSSYYLFSRKVMKIFIYKRPTGKETLNYIKRHINQYLKSKEYNDASNLLFDIEMFTQQKQRDVILEQAIKKKAVFFLKQEKHLEDALNILGVLYRHAPTIEVENLLFSYLNKPSEQSHLAIQVIERDVLPYTTKAKQQSFIKHVRNKTLKIFAILKKSTKKSFFVQRQFAELSAISMNMDVEFKKSCKIFSYIVQNGSFRGPDSYVDAMWFLRNNTYTHIKTNKSCYNEFLKMMTGFVGCKWDGKSCQEISEDHPFTYQSTIFEILKKNPSFAIPLLPILRSLLEKKMLEHPIDLGCTVLKKIIQKIERQKLKTRKPKQRRQRMRLLRSSRKIPQ